MTDELNENGKSEKVTNYDENKKSKETIKSNESINPTEDTKVNEAQPKKSHKKLIIIIVVILALFCILSVVAIIAIVNLFRANLLNTSSNNTTKKVTTITPTKVSGAENNSYCYFETTKTNEDSSPIEQTVYRVLSDGTKQSLLVVSDPYQIFSIDLINSTTLGVKAQAFDDVKRIETFLFKTINLSTRTVNQVIKYEVEATTNESQLDMTLWKDAYSVYMTGNELINGKSYFYLKLVTTTTQKTIVSLPSLGRFGRGLTYSNDSLRLSLSPDKKMILFTIIDPLVSEEANTTFIYDTTGKQIAKFTSTLSPEWFDNSNILYINKANHNIYKANISTKSSTLVFDVSNKETYGLRYLSGKILYWKLNESTTPSIFVYDMVNNVETMLLDMASSPTWIDSNTFLYSKVAACKDGMMGNNACGMFPYYSEGTYKYELSSKKNSFLTKSPFSMIPSFTSAVCEDVFCVD